MASIWPRRRGGGDSGRGLAAVSRTAWSLIASASIPLPAHAQEEEGPSIISFRVSPVKVVPGDIMTATAELESSGGIVSAAVDWGGIDSTALTLISGDASRGVWQATWLVHDTEIRDYLAVLSVVDAAGRTAEATATWSDPPETGWVSPDGFSDPGNQWSNEALSYDGNTTTYAANTYGSAGWGQFIYLTLGSPIYSNRIRVNADYLDAHILAVDVDVFRDGAWVDVFEGGNEAEWNCRWAEVAFDGGDVTQARFRWNYRVSGWNYWLYEFQFYRAGTAVVAPTAETQSAEWVQDTAATLRGLIVNDGGAPNEYRFQYGPTAAYGSVTAWTGGLASGDTFSEFATGLSANTTYHFLAQSRNSAGEASGSDMTFRTRSPATGWISPSAFSDPDSRWTDELAATDQNPLTYARSYHNSGDPQWSSYIHYSIGSIVSEKIRFDARGGSQVNAVDVDVFRDGAWVDVYQGSFVGLQYVELEFSEGSVTEARIRFQAANSSEGFFFQLYEFQFLKSSESTGEACLDLGAIMIDDYLAEMPVDPSSGTPEITQYAIRKSGQSKIEVYACVAELDRDIQSTR
ncbi:hypothetical protein JW899_04840 [Candidatus Uhrbacteria bacterium]|nr:hypothetical protein [Candidatus Uhrbacteria bacterium]